MTGDEGRRVVPASWPYSAETYEAFAALKQAGFTNVVVSKRNGQIELDPHVTGACVLTLAEDEAGVLRDALIGWLG